MKRTSPYDTGLDRNPANYAPLSPLSFLARTAEVFPGRIAVVHGDFQANWGEIYRRARRLASALARRGIGAGDTVAVMAPNIPAMFEAHFGVPMSGAVLNTLNTRLDAEAIAFMLNHGEAKALLTDREFSSTICAALRRSITAMLVIDIDDPLGSGGELLGEMGYEAFLESGDPGFEWTLPQDEWDAIALSYTSGTTGNPKGVVTHHRGAYLNAVGNIVTWAMPHFPVLSVDPADVPLQRLVFSLDAGRGGGHQRVPAQGRGRTGFRPDPPPQSDAFLRRAGGSQHAINAPADMRAGIGHKVSAMIAGAAPPQTVIEGMERIGVDLTHVYGLTEVYGPASVCAKHPEWDRLPAEKRAELNGRQGVRYEMQEGMDVFDPKTMQPVARDGQTMGEISFAATSP